MTYRSLYLSVSVNGAVLTDVLAAHVGLGLDTRVATAQVDVVTPPASLFTWDPVVITMGATEATAAVRFTGYFMQAERSLYPVGATLICKGTLALAELLETEVQRDLTHEHAGATDQVMVSELLYWCRSSGSWTPADAPTAMTGIGGTGKVLGRSAEFKWYKGASGLGLIGLLDGISLGYRTRDTFSGAIARTLVSSIPAASPVATFTEGVDIADAGETKSVIEARNKITVQGYPGANNDNALEYTAYDANPFLLSADGWQWYLIETVTSAWIERELTADAGDGLACQEVAEWLLAEKNRYQQVVELTTPRDDVIEPGDTICVVSPSRLGVTSRNFWVKQVAIACSGTFRQRFTCLTPLPLTEGRNASVLLKLHAHATARARAPLSAVATTPPEAVGAPARAAAKAWAPVITTGALIAVPAAAQATARALAPAAVGVAAGNYLLLETGDRLLLETGDGLLLEGA